MPLPAVIPLDVASAKRAAVAEACRHDRRCPRAHSDGLDAAMGMPRKPAAKSSGRSLRKSSEEQEGIELARLAEAEGTRSFYARTFHCRARFDNAFHRSDRHEKWPFEWGKMYA